jgi:DNA-binding transcriptional LysR family regulator
VDFRQLEALKQIVDEGSFTLAARRLGRSQAALSQQIRSLEREVGEPLVVRARPKAYATDAARRLLGRADRILSDMAGIKDEFERSRHGNAGGTVRVAATPLAITYLYGGLLARFIARYPTIEIVVHATETTQDPVKRVLEQSADIGFTVFPQTDKNLVLFPIVSAEQVFIVGIQHPLAGNGAASPQEIRSYPFVRFERGTGPRMISDEFFRGDGYPPILAESNEMEYVKRIVRMGLGVALVPVFCIRQELKDGVLRPIRSRTGRITQLAGVVTRKEGVSPSVAKFQKACAQLRGRKPLAISLERVAKPPFERRT